MACNTNEGLVYVLHSPRCKYVKIGRTNVALVERLRGINGSSNYGPLGLWTAAGCIRVFDTELVEKRLHKKFATKRSLTFAGIDELFEISVQEALDEFERIEPDLKSGHPHANRLFKDHIFRDYLLRLFTTTGLFGALDLQGAWTMSLYPATSGGRYFTLNIGTHEVAFSSLSANKLSEGQANLLVLDEMILDFAETTSWLAANRGAIHETPYGTDRGRSVLVEIAGGFVGPLQFLDLPGVRKSLIAYWMDWLAEMRERQTKSLFARFHNYEAVFALSDYRRLRDSI